jgi:hypothetical protein
LALDFVEFNSDQRREAINTRQRFEAWRDAFSRHQACRGSMIWSQTKGHTYLIRAAYDKHGHRRQSSLGLRSPQTEKIKAEFERARAEAEERVKLLQPVLARQAGINRVLGLGRVPLIGARIIRSLDAHGLLGAGIRVLGTNAIYAYEAAAGVRIDSGLTTTEDVDLLLDSRVGMSFIATDDIEEASLLRILQRVDKSFERSRQDFRAVNKAGYLVDLIKPLRNPPWTIESAKVGNDPDDLAAVEIAGLSWHESAPAFEAIAIDERGEPLRIVTSDPRIFVAHKYWLSKRADREAIRRRRDGEQAKAIATLIATHMPHLAFEWEALRMLPKELVEEVKPLFEARDLNSAFNL